MELTTKIFFLFLLFITVFLILVKTHPEYFTRISEHIPKEIQPGEYYSCSFPEKYGFTCNVINWDPVKGEARLVITSNRSTYLEYVYCESEGKGIYLDRLPENGTYIQKQVNPNQKIYLTVRCVDYKRGSYRGHIYLWYGGEQNLLAVGSITVYPVN